MPPRQSIDSLPDEMKLEIAVRSSSLASRALACVSRSWCAFIKAADWYLLFKRDFHISKNTLDRFIRYAEKYAPGLRVLLPELHQKLSFLAKQYNEYAFFYLQEYHLPLLACALNHAKAKNVLKKLVPADDAPHWLEAAVKMHANQTVMLLIELYPAFWSEATLELACEARNQALVLQLLEFPLLDWQKARLPAICYDRDVLFVFLYRYPKWAYEQRRWIIDTVATTGELSFFLDVIDYYRQKHGNDINKVNDRHAPLQHAAYSSSPELFQYLVENFPALFCDLKKDISLFSEWLLQNKRNVDLIYQRDASFFNEGVVLAEVGLCGNVEVAKFFIEKFRADPLEILRSLQKRSAGGGESIKGREALLIYLIEAFGHLEGFKLRDEIFDIAAENEELFRYLRQKFTFTPTNKALGFAIQGGNKKLFEELQRDFTLEPQVDSLIAVGKKGDVSWFSRLMDQYHVHVPLETCTWQLPEWSLAITRMILVKGLGEDQWRGNGPRKFLSEALYESHNVISEGLKCYRGGYRSRALRYWLEAAKYSPRHFYTFITRAISNPRDFNLNTRDIETLQEAAKQALSVTVTIPEQDEIYQLLSDSKDRVLLELAETFNPNPESMMHQPRGY